jgi:CDP-paratose 2-epimerase
MTTLITGGAGFVGTNLADRLAGEGERVIVYDNVSRDGVEENLRWLTHRHPNVDAVTADLCDRDLLRSPVRAADRIFHLAGQVAVTSSLSDPMEDFEVNLRGTVSLLEEARAAFRPRPLVFTSTNKVYGGLEDVQMRVAGDRYEPVSAGVRRRGIGEARPLAFRTPYGCSKGGADQYVADYARAYGMPNVVLRMSCIYGPHQFGNEDQGWVAHFLIRALRGEPITIYGDGRQVRDVLYVSDLVDALMLACGGATQLAGRAFNLGGGPRNAISLLELLGLIEELQDIPPEVEFRDWRQGDQRYYVSDTSAFQEATGWWPAVDVRDGVAGLHAWLAEHREPSRTSLAA